MLDGIALGRPVGSVVGLDEGGVLGETLGKGEGFLVRLLDGFAVIAFFVGFFVGCLLTRRDGCRDGFFVGFDDDFFEGLELGGVSTMKINEMLFPDDMILVILIPVL